MTDIPQPRAVPPASKACFANSKLLLELRQRFRIFRGLHVGLVRALLKETASFW
jgi:hypothetical protein